MDKGVRKLLDDARRQGFTAVATDAGHAQVRDPEGVVVAVLPATGDPRALRNALHALHAAGLAQPKGR